ANVIRSVGLGLPGLPVDTHVGRLSRRLGLTAETDPVKAEHELSSLLPPAEWGSFSLRLILHGRRVCVARRPRCVDCVLNDYCPSAELPARGARARPGTRTKQRSEEHTSELQSPYDLVCRLLLEKKKKNTKKQ